MSQQANDLNTEFIDVGGMADAKNRCPHVSLSCQIPSNDEIKNLSKISGNTVCCINECDKTECWVCIHCHETYCGRYGNKHMIKHYNDSDNTVCCIAMGIGDLSFWCYKCDSYLNHLTIKKIFNYYELMHIAKFGEKIPAQLLQQTNFAEDNNNNNNNDDEDGDAKIDDNDVDDNVDDNENEMKIMDIDNDENIIKWNNELNVPKIDKILSNIHDKKVHVGPYQSEKKKKKSNSDIFMFGGSSRDVLSNYSLFDKIESKLKLFCIKQCIDKNKYLSRCIASIYGMGIGDATGAPLEFLQCCQCFGESYFQLKGRKKWFNELNTFRLKRGQWTDDASMGLCMADSLILHKKYDGSDIRTRFWNWWNNGYNNAFRLDKTRKYKSSIGLGGNISKSIYSMKHNVIPTATFVTDTDKDDSGNGSLMRLSPIPIFFCHFYENENMIDIAMKYAKQSSFTTHPGYIAAESCALMSYIIINAIQRDNTNYSNNLNTDNVETFLENVTCSYLKRIEMEHKELKNTLQELVKSKQFQYIRNKMQTNNDDQDNDDQDDDDDDDMNEKYMNNAWSKIQIKLNHIHRQIIAKKLIIKLIKSEENDDSTERCWNWKCKYGDLGIDKTMKNRGNSYNGYPNTEGYFGSYCMDGLAMGLHSVYNSNTFGDAIQNAVNLLGDADSTGSITGQIAGAWYGFNDVFYNKNKEQFLFKQISKWDDYEFGLRGILLYVIGQNYAQNYQNNVKQQQQQNSSQ